MKRNLRIALRTVDEPKKKLRKQMRIYMSAIGKHRIREIAYKIEADILKNITGGW